MSEGSVELWPALFVVVMGPDSGFKLFEACFIECLGSSNESSRRSCKRTACDHGQNVTRPCNDPPTCSLINTHAAPAYHPPERPCIVISKLDPDRGSSSLHSSPWQWGRFPPIFCVHSHRADTESKGSIAQRPRRGGERGVSPFHCVSRSVRSWGMNIGVPARGEWLRMRVS